MPSIRSRHTLRRRTSIASKRHTLRSKLQVYARRPSTDSGSVPLQPKEHKGLLRRLTLLWKRLTRPSRPRHSRRFSFIPSGFEAVSRTPSFQHRQARRARRNGIVFDTSTPSAFLQQFEKNHV